MDLAMQLMLSDMLGHSGRIWDHFVKWADGEVKQYAFFRAEIACLEDIYRGSGLILLRDYHHRRKRWSKRSSAIKSISDKWQRPFLQPEQMFDTLVLTGEAMGLVLLVQSLKGHPCTGPR